MRGIRGWQGQRRLLPVIFEIVKQGRNNAGRSRSAKGHGSPAGRESGIAAANGVPHRADPGIDFKNPVRIPRLMDGKNLQSGDMMPASEIEFFPGEPQQ